jgi:hypothetical protein
MAIWILSTGNSDVQLKDNSYSLWEKLLNDAKEKAPLDICHDRNNKFLNLTKDDLIRLYPVPARVLGLAYKEKLQENFYNLDFPLLNTFFKFFDKDDLQNQLSKIIILLTDQSSIFGINGENSSPECPYWQDTIELKTILEKYFKTKNINNTKILFKTLTPESKEQGLDHWEYTLSEVERKIHEAVEEVNYKFEQNEIVYISHQAGTPAISSALQFVSLSKFKKVKFLVSNPLYDMDTLEYQPQSIDSSKYARSIQIQKAKQLIVDGFPGAALKILEAITEIDTTIKLQLKRLVGVLNIENNLVKGNEFDVEPAIYRVIDALEIVHILFENRNYIQGITLLAAAHETFMKAAIVKKLHKDNKDNNIKWSEPGLGFVGNLDREAKIAILRKLNFPVDNSLFNKKLKNKDTDINRIIGSNEGMFEWLCKLYDSSFKPTSWKLLQYIGKYLRSYGTDRRNQLMHNLVGAKPKEVIKYLLGDQDKYISQYTDDNAGVIRAYEKEVKQPFLEQIKKLGLPYKESDLRKQLQEIASKLR